MPSQKQPDGIDQAPPSQPREWRFSKIPRARFLELAKMGIQEAEEAKKIRKPQREMARQKASQSK